MTFDYEKLEKDLEEACEVIQKNLHAKFNENYSSVGSAKLEAFIHSIQLTFERAALDFLNKHNLLGDPEAKKRALTITKLYAKRCVEDFSKVN